MIGNGIGLPIKRRRRGAACIGPANTAAPVVSGLLQKGDTLTTTDGTWTGTGPLTYTYQWKRNSVSISAATANTYVIVDADLDQDIQCEVTANSPCGASPLSVLSNTVVPEYNPMAEDWFDQAVVNGTTIPDAYKIIYNNLFINLKGLGVMGSDDCFTAYKVIKGSPGYYDGVTKWPLLSDLVTPTNTPMSEINGGGSYVNIGTDPNVYTRQAAALKAWNIQETPSLLAYLTTSSAAYGTWFLTDITADNSLYLLGCSNGAFTSQLGLQPRTSNQTIAVVNGTSYFGASTSGAHGYYEIHRTAVSGAGCTQMLKDNSVIATGNNTSTTVPDTNIICCGFSYDNGSSISQTVTGGETPNDGLITIIDRSAWTTAMGQQFYDSFVQFYTDLGITL